MSGVRTIAIYADTRGHGHCRGCMARITWAEVVATGKKMPFDGEPVALRTENERPNSSDPLGTTGGRVIEHVDLSENHWGSCPQRAQFKKGAQR